MSRSTCSNNYSRAQAAPDNSESERRKKYLRREAHLFFLDGATVINDPNAAPFFAVEYLKSKIGECLEYIEEWKSEGVTIPVRYYTNGPVGQLKPSEFFVNKTRKARNLLEHVRGLHITPAHEAFSIVNNALADWNAALSKLKMKEDPTACSENGRWYERETRLKAGRAKTGERVLFRLRAPHARAKRQTRLRPKNAALCSERRPRHESDGHDRRAGA
jgi:hypothetical protein